MGDRIVYTIRQTDGLSLNLYSHWGGHDRYRDLGHALSVSRPRWNDENYCSRIIISNLIGPLWDQETGFGLWASSEDGMYGGDYPDITINMKDKTVTDETGTHDWEQFIEYHYVLDKAKDAVV